MQTRERRLKGEAERLTEGGGGLGGAAHRWLWEAVVPVELFRIVPASSETVTQVRRANGLPQNGWLDLGKQMLKNAFQMSPGTEEKSCGPSPFGTESFDTL